MRSSFSLPLCLWGFVVASDLFSKDAVDPDDLTAFNKLLDETKGDEFEDLYLNEDGLVQLDIYQYPSNELRTTGVFRPSPLADAYFEQERQIAYSLGDTDDIDKGGPLGLGKRTDLLGRPESQQKV